VISCLLVACFAISQAKSDEFQPVAPSEIWANGNKNFLSITDDFRSLDVTVPLPALPYMPPISFHGHSFEALGAGTRAWQEGGSMTVRAQLPFGLTLEAGNRFDR
jgi:hypothetical protein